MRDQLLIQICVGLLLVTGLLHSIAGEHFLLRPLFKYRGNKVLDIGLARVVLRGAWHVTTLMWLLLAWLVYSIDDLSDPQSKALLFGIGWTFSAIGLVDLIVSKGRHVGWPFLFAIGLTALGAYF